MIKNCPGRKTHQNISTVLGLNDNHSELQIQSSPFRLNTNESRTSPQNFRPIGPQTKRDQTFDEIWAMKRKALIFSLLFLSQNPVALSPSFTLLVAELSSALLYKGLRGLKLWALKLGLPHEEKSNNMLYFSGFHYECD